MYQKILLSVDVNDEMSWRKALPVALKQCEAFGAELHVVTVVPKLPTGLINAYVPGLASETMTKDAEGKLAELVAGNVPDGVPVVRHVSHGNIYQGILHAAEKAGADLIVMASHRPEMSDFLLGPNAARVVRHSVCSVLVVRD